LIPIILQKWVFYKGELKSQISQVNAIISGGTFWFDAVNSNGEKEIKL
jgi:hypothetical protein